MCLKNLASAAESIYWNCITAKNFVVDVSLCSLRWLSCMGIFSLLSLVFLFAGTKVVFFSGISVGFCARERDREIPTDTLARFYWSKDHETSWDPITKLAKNPSIAHVFPPPRMLTCAKRVS